MAQNLAANLDLSTEENASIFSNSKHWSPFLSFKFLSLPRFTNTFVLNGQAIHRRSKWLQ